jgi:dihydrofolate reductase
MKVNIITAYCKNGGLGKNNTLIWNIKSDMAKFKKLTIGNGNNAVIMGRKTFESINNINGLVNRDNLILSKSLNIDKLNGKNNIKSFVSIEAIDEYVKTKTYSELWVIGGAEIYELFLNNYKKLENSIFNIDEIVITYIDTDFECDCFFPDLNNYIDKYNLHFYSKKVIKNMQPNTESNAESNADSRQNYNIYDVVYKFI